MARPARSASPPLRAAILARVSSEDQREYGHSLPEQVRLGREYCDRKGYHLADDLIFSGDESGTRPIDKRPVLQALIAAVLARRVDVVVVLHTSRLTRDQDTHGHLRWLFGQHGARVEYVLQEVPAGPMGTAMLGLYGFKDAQESADITWRTQNGIKAKVASGKPIGAAKAPYGLRYVPTQTDAVGRRVPGTHRAAYEADPATAGYLVEMFRRYDGGSSLRGLRDWLEGERVLPPKHGYGGRTSARWSVTSIRHILRNAAYTGKGTALHASGSGDDPVALPDGVFPKLIEPALFDRVQRRLDDSRRETQRRDRNPEIGLLRRGILRCPKCKGAMRVNVGTKGGPTYRCPENQRRRHGCPGASMLCHKLDHEVWTWIQAIRKDPRGAAALVERLRARPDDAGQAAALLAAKDAQIADLLQRRDNVLSNLERVTGELAGDLQARYADLGDQLKAAQAQRERIADQAKAEVERRRRTERAIATIEGTPHDLWALSYHEKRRVLSDLGMTVWLYPADSIVRWWMTLDFGTAQAQGNSDGWVSVWNRGDGSDVRVYLGSDLPLPDGYTGIPPEDGNLCTTSSGSSGTRTRS